jgi:hypothetical protein
MQFHALAIAKSPDHLAAQGLADRAADVGAAPRAAIGKIDKTWLRVDYARGKLSTDGQRLKPGDGPSA